MLIYNTGSHVDAAHGELKAIEEALQRLEEVTYGICGDEEIPIKRLYALLRPGDVALCDVSAASGSFGGSGKVKGVGMGAVLFCILEEPDPFAGTRQRSILTGEWFDNVVSADCVHGFTSLPHWNPITKGTP